MGRKLEKKLLDPFVAFTAILLGIILCTSFDTQLSSPIGDPLVKVDCSVRESALVCQVSSLQVKAFASMRKATCVYAGFIWSGSRRWCCCRCSSRWHIGLKHAQATVLGHVWITGVTQLVVLCIGDGSVVLVHKVRLSNDVDTNSLSLPCFFAFALSVQTHILHTFWKATVAAGQIYRRLLKLLCFSLSFWNIDAPTRKISFRKEFCSNNNPGFFFTCNNSRVFKIVLKD